ncbi:CBS domain-containing protein CBSX3, mitochondrial [Linum perenne]
MEGAIEAFFSRAGVVETTLLQHVWALNPALRPLIFSRSESVSSVARFEEHGFEHTTISDVLSAKGKDFPHFFLFRVVRSEIGIRSLFADDLAQCWSIGGGETWRAEVDRRNHH